MTDARDEEAVIREILGKYRTITVVGCSATPGKDAHDIPESMLRNGFEVVPINPRASEILGRRAYASLKDAPDARFVNVFRPAAEAPDVTRAAIDAGAEVVWLQTGIASGEARRIAEAAGVTFIEDRCVRSEWTRHYG